MGLGMPRSPPSPHLTCIPDDCSPLNLMHTELLSYFPHSWPPDGNSRKFREIYSLSWMHEVRANHGELEHFLNWSGMHDNWPDGTTY